MPEREKNENGGGRREAGGEIHRGNLAPDLEEKIEEVIEKEAHNTGANRKSQPTATKLQPPRLDQKPGKQKKIKIAKGGRGR